MVELCPQECFGNTWRALIEFASEDADLVQSYVMSYMSGSIWGAVFPPPLLSAYEVPSRPILDSWFEIHVGKVGRCQLRLPRQEPGVTLGRKKIGLGSLAKRRLKLDLTMLLLEGR